MIPQRVVDDITEAVKIYNFTRDIRGHEQALRSVATYAFQRGMQWQKEIGKEEHSDTPT